MARKSMPLDFVEEVQFSFFDCFDNSNLEKYCPSSDSATEQQNHFLSDKEIEQFVFQSCNNKETRMEIVFEFSKIGKTKAKHIAFLKEVLCGGCGLHMGRFLSSWYTDNGLEVAFGRAARSSRHTQIISWDEIASAIQAMLEEGRYTFPEELDKAEEHSISEVAKKVLYMAFDLSPDNAAMFLGSVPRTGGFPVMIETLTTMLLQDAKRLEQIQRELHDFADAYHKDRNIMRFHYHKVPAVVQMVDELSLERCHFGSVSEPVLVPAFITDDEIQWMLERRGSGVDGWKKRFQDSVCLPFDERTQFFKREFGTGGHSPALLGAWFSDESHDSAGITIKKLNCNSKHLSWPDVTKIYDGLLGPSKNCMVG